MILLGSHEISAGALQLTISVQLVSEPEGYSPACMWCE